MELGDLVPLLTAATGASDLRLRGAGIDVLENARHASRKIVLVAVLQADATPLPPGHERGLYITPKSVNVQEQDAAVLLCTLRFVDIDREPFWGSLLLLLASHLFVASPGAITPASFHPLRFLSDLLTWQITETISAEDPQNAAYVKQLVPKFTWVAIDLKIKEMEGIESPTKYFEAKLTSPPVHGGDDSRDVEAQMIASELLPPTRDCLSLKATTLLTPAGYSSPQAFTSSKILSHALDAVTPKALFGRYLSGGVLLHLLRSVAHSLASQTPIVLQRVVLNVQRSYWKLLLESALEKYSDEMHARLSVYTKVAFNAAYLVDITERKLQSENVSVVNAGQGQFSSFDEFGNLKRASSNSHGLTRNSSGEDARPTLNTGIFSFIKTRAERAFSKQFSSMASNASSSSSSATAALDHIPEDDAADHDTVTTTGSSASETPEDMLRQYNAPIQAYQVPPQYINTPVEAMPMSAAALDRVHREALAVARALILPFVYDLRCIDSSTANGDEPLSFLAVGKHNLLRRIRAVQCRFVLANEAASSLFCAQLVQYLHAVVLAKTDRDNEAQQRSLPRVGRATSSIIPVAVDSKSPPLTKLPLELITYKTNVEALVSQYNFVARGPQSSRVLIGFFQAVVAKRLLALAQKEYNRFADACDSKESKLADLEDTLEDAQRDVARHQKHHEQLAMQEAQSIAHIQRQHRATIAELEAAVAQAAQSIDAALQDQQALYQRTMQATRKTINTIDEVSTKHRVFNGYLEKYERGHVFSKSWRQYYYVLDHATLTCFKSKSAFEERGAPCEPPIVLTGYNVVKSRTDEMKIKLVPPEAGNMLRFRAPASVGREAWMKKFIEAAQLSGKK